MLAASCESELQLPSDEPIILFLSRIHPKKGLELLISAAEQLKHHRFTLIIAGSGDPTYEDSIKALVSNSHLSDRVRFSGFVQGSEKAQLLQGSDVFALTSYSENFGIVVLEALAAGLPVVSTPGVALSTLVEMHELGYVASMTIESVATALEKVLQHPEESKEMGDRARQFVLRNYTWESVAAQLVAIYQCTVHKELKNGH